MLVRDCMTRNVITVKPVTPSCDALSLMKERCIRRLPVLQGEQLVGIVTWTDLMRASPASVRGLPTKEAAALAGTAVMDVMTPDPLTVAEDTTLEEAAVLMRDHKVGGLPVVEDGALSGILTESDLFEAFIKVLGLRSGGARLTIRQANGTDVLEAIVSTIHDCEAGILSMCTYERHGIKWIIVRVDAPFPLHVVQTLVERGIDVIHLAPLAKGGG